jgi:tetratricopeptide (TPR) repeat protein
MMHTRFNKTFVIWLAGLWVAFFVGSSCFAQAAGNCGTLSSLGQFGPYDYRTERGNAFQLVQGAHFTPEVEALIRGKSARTPGPDIDYTLRAFPNHHRALLAMVRLGELEKTDKPNGSHYNIDCWFQRALLFRPDDSIVRMVYASYLSKNDRLPEASSQLEIATSYAKDNPFTHYNIGLHYFDLKNYDKALVQAHKAIELGFTQTALRDKLQSVGKWTEPIASTTAPAIESPSSAPTN